MIKEASNLYAEFIQHFPYTPTVLQDELLRHLAVFIFDDNKEKLFLLKGFAGTGKTTIISTFVNNLWKCGAKSVLLAPTGRAAKVIGLYANKPAFTIHKKIYRQKSSKDGFGKFVLNKNLHSYTFFIVDESSMISNSSNETTMFGSGRLLDDLIEYVYNDKK